MLLVGVEPGEVLPDPGQALRGRGDLLGETLGELAAFGELGLHSVPICRGRLEQDGLVVHGGQRAGQLRTFFPGRPPPGLVQREPKHTAQDVLALTGGGVSQARGIPLPAHGRGQQGLMVETDDGHHGFVRGLSRGDPDPLVAILCAVEVDLRFSASRRRPPTDHPV